MGSAGVPFALLMQARRLLSPIDSSLESKAISRGICCNEFILKYSFLRKQKAGWLIRRFALPPFTFEQEGRARLLPSQDLFLSAITEFFG